MQCPRCNAKLKGSERFCANCGLNLMEWYASEAQSGRVETESENEEDAAKERLSDSYIDPYGGMDKDYNYDPYKDITSAEHDPYKDIEPEEAESEEQTEEDADPVQQQSRSEEVHSDLQQEDSKKTQRSYLPILGLATGIAIGVAGFFLISNAMLLRQNQKTPVSAVSEPDLADTPVSGQKAEGQEAETQKKVQEMPEPTATSEPTPTPEPSWQAAVSKQEQNELQADGTWLDRNHMKSLMDASNSRYGLYVMDLTDYVDYEIGEADTPLPASALIGIPIMYTIAEGVSSGFYSLDAPVVFSYTFENGRGGYKREQNGTAITLGDLLRVGLMYSDNNALNSLLDYLTYDRINEVCHQYGYDSVSLQRKLGEIAPDRENYISPKDAAMMLNAIYQDNFTQIDSSFLRNYYKIGISDTANIGMYPACAGSDTFLNLNGITDTRYNEVGLVENGDEVFIMSVFTVDGQKDRSIPCVSNEAAYILANLKAGEK